MASSRSKKSTATAKKDLWDLAAAAVQTAPPQSQQLSRHVIVVGDAQSGKSTLISTFLNPNKETTPKPTIAIDYSFARKVNAHTGQKEVVRIWELGGELTDEELLKVPLSPKNMASSSVVIVCDLTNSASIVQSLHSKLVLIRQVCEENLRHLRQSNAQMYEELMAAKQGNALQDNHEDKQQNIEPFPIPAILVGTKYDSFKDVESAKRRVLLQALRAVAHLHGATFVCSSSIDKAARDLTRAQLAAASFRTQLRPVYQTDIEKPVGVSWGRDSFAKILQPSLSGVDTTTLQRHAGNPDRIVEALVRAVGDAYGHHSAQQESKAREDDVELENQNDSEDQLRFADPIIDEARAQKALELAQFQELQSRHRKQKQISGAM